jgi:hypothetical protein
MKEQQRVQEERRQWDQSWAKYQALWVRFNAISSRDGAVGDAIPWPVKSGLFRDVKASSVEQFLQSAAPRDADRAQLRRKESLKWHPDRVKNWLRGGTLTDDERTIIKMIDIVVTNMSD